MDTGTWILVIGVIAIALMFDVINGFHDAANSIATVVSTRVLSPRMAVLWAAFFNFVAMFIFHKAKVADTVGSIVNIQTADPAFIYVILCGLLGAIVWDLLTWVLGLPTSSSHALIGGMVGAGMVHGGIALINWTKVGKVILFIPLAPMIGLLFGFAIMIGVFWLLRRWTPAAVDRVFRKGQFISAALYSLGHGGNDAQKTMGIICVLLVAAGLRKPGTPLEITHLDSLWIILSCQMAMALGTAFGGWRIVKTMGMKITKLKPVGGFCAETAGAVTLFMSTYLGIPVSTTHTITGAIIGVGATTKLSGIKWGVAQRIVWAWLVTIPFSALIAALCYGAVKLFHPAF
ncbi:MAG TPA: inorganic phosphate transporter [Opitutales bacterium]|nr:inorganic phosphate transporter [Opitutales bacterium]